MFLTGYDTFSLFTEPFDTYFFLRDPFSLIDKTQMEVGLF